MNKIAIALALVALAACAKKPESIAPAYVSPVQYSGLSCAQLASELDRVNTAYETAAAQQNKARSNDTIGVILLGVPVSSLSGDNVAPQIAALKGQRETLTKQMTVQNCTT